MLLRIQPLKNIHKFTGLDKKKTQPNTPRVSILRSSTEASELTMVLWYTCYAVSHLEHLLERVGGDIKTIKETTKILGSRKISSANTQRAGSKTPASRSEAGIMYLDLSECSFVNLIISYLRGSSHGHLKALITFWNLNRGESAKLVQRLPFCRELDTHHDLLPHNCPPPAAC